MNHRIFYGWVIVAAACICYGFGIGPAYVSWGFLAPEMIADLGISRGELGGVFGIFTFVYSGSAILVALLHRRVSIRNIMAAGFAISALGFFMMSRAASVLDCYVAFALLGGIGIGMSTVVPCQTLGQNWFVRRRALAIAVIMAAGGVALSVYPHVNRFVYAHGTWRTAWLVIAAISAALVAFTLAFIRDTPESMGLTRDGIPHGDTVAPASKRIRPMRVTDDTWTTAHALRTPQFYLLLVCGVAHLLPWTVLMSHGRLFFEDLGIGVSGNASLHSPLALLSIVGRLSGLLGDWLPPQVVLGASLVLEALGTGCLLLVHTPWQAYLCVMAIGLGFGGAYTSTPVAFAYFFGRNAFATTGAIRVVFTGAFSALGPWGAGSIHDATGSYAIAFLVFAGVALAGALSAALCKHPGGSPLSEVTTPNPAEWDPL